MSIVSNSILSGATLTANAANNALAAQQDLGSFAYNGLSLQLTLSSAVKTGVPVIVYFAFGMKDYTGIETTIPTEMYSKAQSLQLRTAATNNIAVSTPYYVTARYLYTWVTYDTLDTATTISLDYIGYGFSEGSAVDVNGVARSALVDTDGAQVITNTPSIFVDGFNTLNPAAWNTVAKATGDLLLSEGNALNSSYLAMSLDPTADNTETYLESVATYANPARISIAASLSQRQIGQEASFEWVSTEAANGVISSIAISTLSQTTTFLTINTATPHGLKPSDRISVGGCADSRANFPCLIVATAPTTTQIVCSHTGTANITSQAITSQTTGTVYVRNAMKFAPNGASMNFDTASATEATFFSRSSGIGSYVSGTPLSTQKITVATTATAASQMPNLTGVYCYAPSSIYELVHQPDHYEWMDKAIDSATAGYTVRFRKDQVVPDPSKFYKLRMRIRNNAGATRVTSKIIRCVKTASATSTVTHDGLVTYTVGDYVHLFGRRDIAANFANLTTANGVVIASIIDSSNFTVVDGSVAAATTYGGAVVRVNGTVSSTGIATMSIQSAIRGADGYLILTGSATWAGVAIGDLVNVYGARVDLTGADLGIDGTYRVRDLVTSTLTLESVGTTGSSTFSSTNCGGCVIKRTDLRVSAVRIAPYTRTLVESTGGITKLDQASAAPVYLTGGTNLTISTLPTLAAVTTVSTVTGVTTLSNGQTAHASNITGSPLRLGGRSATANYNPVTTGQAADLVTTLTGSLIQKPFSIPEAEFGVVDSITASTTAVQIKALTASNKNYVTGITLSSATLGVAGELQLRSTPVASASATITSNTLVVPSTYNFKVGDLIYVTASTVTGLTAGSYYYLLTVSGASLTFSATRGGATSTISGTLVTATISKILWRANMQTASLPLTHAIFPNPLDGGTGLAIEMCTPTSLTSGRIDFNVFGYVAP